MMLGQAELAAQHRLRRGGAHADDQPGMGSRQLRLQPRAAGFDLVRARLLMDPQFALADPLEVFDRVGDVNRAALDSGLLQRLVENLARRADERMALKVFLVARLLADQHDLRILRAFSEDGLSGVAPQVASLAAG